MLLASLLVVAGLAADVASGPAQVAQTVRIGRLVGTSSYRVVLVPGGKNVGQGEVVVRRVRGRGPARLEVDATFTTDVGDGVGVLREHVMLDRRLAIVDLETIEERPDAPRRVLHAQAPRAGSEEGWTLSRHGEGLPEVATLASGAAHYGSLITAGLIARALHRHEGAFQFPAVAWEADTPRASDVRVAVVRDAPIEALGHGARADVVRVQGDAGGWTFAIDDRGRIAQWATDGPLRVVACSGATCTEDLPRGDDPDAPIRDVVVGFFALVVGTRPMTELGDVVDLEGAWRRDATGSPFDRYVAEVARGMAAHRAPELAGMLPVLDAALVVERRGDDLARVSVPGLAADPFELRRVDGRWLVVLDTSE